MSAVERGVDMVGRGGRREDGVCMTRAVKRGLRRLVGGFGIGWLESARSEI